MAVPNSNITKSIAVAGDGFRRTDDPDGTGLAPTAPPTFTTSVTSSSITATITQANGATDYECRVDSGAAVTGLTVSGLSGGTTYAFQVRGNNAYGTSDWSSVVNVETSPASGGGTGDISWTGTVAHGSTLTITDAQSRFGTRVNVKPLYVNLASGKTGSTLGRKTGDFFDTAASYTTAKSVGSLPGSVVFNHSGNSNDAFGGVTFDPAKPLIQYLERYYDYDITDPAQQSGGGFNLKPNRYWVTDSPSGPNNLYIGLQGSEGGNIRYVVENVGTTGAWREYYGSELSWSSMRFVWTSEEFLFENSDIATDNGLINHVFNNVQRIDANTNCRTRSNTNTGQLKAAYLDQVSAGALQTSNTYYGYQCWDDEYAGVYIGNASTRGACTKFVRLPQTAWSTGEVSVYLVESHIPLETGYLYFRTGQTTFISNAGVSLA